jgi:hypothetical protein
MLSYLLMMTLILMVSVGNLAIGFGLAVHLGHGPAKGWQVICFWKKDGVAHADPHAAADAHAPPAEATAPTGHAPAHH